VNANNVSGRRWPPEALHGVACSDARLLAFPVCVPSPFFVKETVTMIVIAKGSSRLQEN
jgi:hypothetical protein